MRRRVATTPPGHALLSLVRESPEASTTTQQRIDGVALGLSNAIDEGEVLLAAHSDLVARDPVRADVIDKTLAAAI